MEENKSTAFLAQAPRPVFASFVWPNGHSYGITKREYFAALAMAGLMDPDVGISLSPLECAQQSVAQADALIAELAK